MGDGSPSDDPDCMTLMSQRTMPTVFPASRRVRWHTALGVLLAMLASLLLSTASAVPGACMPSQHIVQAGASAAITCDACANPGSPDDGRCTTAAPAGCDDCPLCGAPASLLTEQPRQANLMRSSQAPPALTPTPYRSFIPAAPQRPPALSRSPLEHLTASANG